MKTSAALGERIARHGIARPCATTPVAAVRLTTAVQAQDAAASRLGVRARSTGLTEPDVVRAISVDRTLVRTWLMRGTIHLVTASDVRWLARLIGPSIVRKFHTRWRQLGLTEDVLAQAVAALPDVLADGPLSRREIRTGLYERGVALESPDPQAHTHALVYASAIGLVCRGPDRGRDALFTLLDQWLPDEPEGPSGDTALAELARRYFAAYSPATAADFATWSGLAAGKAIDLIRDELEPIELDGRPAWRHGKVEPVRGVRLLPAFDNYLLGYRDREAILESGLQPHVFKGGLILPTVVRDGQVIGSWALDRAGQRVTITPFRSLTGPIRSAVDAEVADVGRFLGLDLALGLAPALS